MTQMDEFEDESTKDSPDQDQPGDAIDRDHAQQLNPAPEADGAGRLGLEGAPLEGDDQEMDQDEQEEDEYEEEGEGEGQEEDEYEEEGEGEDEEEDEYEEEGEDEGQEEDESDEDETRPPLATLADSNSRDSGFSTKTRFQFPMVALPAMQGEPLGMRRADDDGRELLDAMAGRNSVFGFGCTPILEAMADCLSRYLGDGSFFSDVADRGESPLSKHLDEFFASSTCVSADSMLLLPSPDLALEHAIQIARRFRPDKSFRTIALLGSDHGRTGMCRTASGRPHLHEGLGPMMAGFSHLPVGDLEAVRASIDDQTAAVLLSPIDLGNAALACAPDYLVGVREVCNERGVLLIIDETQIVFGSTGQKFVFSELADVHADIVVASSGLFSGLSAGLVLASHHVTGGSVRDLQRYPLQAAALMATISEMHHHGLPADVSEIARDLAVVVAEQLKGFEFVRDMNVTGMTIGIETDVSAEDVVAAAAASGLRVEAAGDAGIRLQPPLLMREEDRRLLLARLVESMEVIERETSGMAL